MNRTSIEFLLYDWLLVDQLPSRERYSEHSRETFEAVLDSERLARDKRGGSGCLDS